MALQEETLAGYQDVVDPEDGGILYCRYNLGVILGTADRDDEAAAIFEEMLPVCQRVLGPDDELTQAVANNAAYYRESREVSAEPEEPADGAAEGGLA